MSCSIDIIKNALKEKQVYNLKTLTLKLQKRNLRVTEEDVMYLLLDLLEDEFIKYNIYGSINDYKYVYKSFKYLNSNSNLKIITNQDDFCNELEKVYLIINKKLKKARFRNINSIFRNSIDFLEKIKNNMDLIKIQLHTREEKPKETIDDNYLDDNIEFTNHLIFHVKNYNYVEEMLKTFPQLITSKSKNNKYLLDNIITEYLNNLYMKNSNYNILYFEKLIDFFIESPKFFITKSYQNELVKRFELEKEKLKHSGLKKKDRTKAEFFINDVISKLKHIEPTTYDSFLSNINYKYSINPSFSKEVTNEVRMIKNIDNKNILDLRNKRVVTVDSIFAKSFDDAFSLEMLPNGNFLLGVYMTDVSKYVSVGSNLNKAAYDKSSTIYLPDYNILMLPEYLTFDKCSLKAKEDKEVIAHMFEFSNSLELIKFNVDRALINISDNLNFEEVNIILNDEKTSLEDLKYYEQILKFVSDLKSKNIFDRNYHTIKALKRNLTSSDKPALDKYNNSYASVVENLMILTNYFVAKEFNDSGNCPFIYRVNKSNIDKDLQEEALKMVSNDVNIEEALTCINKLYIPSYYSTDNAGHKGLNLDAYCHISTPIRNFASLESQRLEKQFLIDKEFVSDPEYYEMETKLNLECKYINERNQMNEEYKTEYYKMYQKVKKS